MSVEVVPTRDLSSGRYHKRYYDSETGKFASYEGCNLDEAGAFERVTWLETENAEPDQLCENDWPPEHQDQQAG